MDEDENDRQFSEPARAAYAQRAEAFLEALQRHIDVNLSRKGRQRELEPYFASQSALFAAARSFEDAEFDWCGGFPLPLTPAEDDDDDDDDGWDDEPDAANGGVLSVVGRWDYRVIDEEALIAAGRRAYLDAWTDDTPEDAEFRVADAGSAAGEILHGDNLNALNEAPGLRQHQYAVDVLIHPGDDDFDNDPFGLVTPHTR